MNMEDKVLPSSEEAEKLVLATIMTEKNALSSVRELLTVEAFYYQKHREIYEAALRIADRGDFPDIIAVMNELQKGGSKVTPFELTEISGNSTPYLQQNVALVFDKYKRRQFFEIGCYLQANCVDTN